MFNFPIVIMETKKIVIPHFFIIIMIYGKNVLLRKDIEKFININLISFSKRK